MTPEVFTMTVDAELQTGTTMVSRVLVRDGRTTSFAPYIFCALMAERGENLRILMHDHFKHQPFNIRVGRFGLRLTDAPFHQRHLGFAGEGVILGVQPLGFFTSNGPQDGIPLARNAVVRWIDFCLAQSSPLDVMETPGLGMLDTEIIQEYAEHMNINQKLEDIHGELTKDPRLASLFSP